MTHKQLFGRLCVALGEQLIDTESDLYNSIEMSEEQLFAIMKFAKILVSPSVQVRYIQDLEARFGVSRSTINNWIDMGFINRGHKRAGDTRTFWYDSELDEDEKLLRRMGYIKKPKSKVAKEMERARQYLKYDDCKEM